MDAVAPRIDDSTPFYDRWFLSMINDPRDLPFVHLTIACSTVAILGLALYFVPDAYFWPCALVYGLLWGFWVLDRYILMLHCTSHRVLFNRPFRKLNRLIPWVLGPFFGETPETYFVHHLGMHHPENNLPDDLSSTMRYQRDRFGHWLQYFLRFFFTGIAQLASYHVRKNNPKMVRGLLIGEIGFWVFAAATMLISVKAAFVVFIIPVCTVRVLMMAGNWGQHAFVDASDPANPYLNSITCIKSRYNRRCFNDGYHIHHHVNARAHWSDLPTEFEENIDEYGRQDAIVFEGIDFFMVWLFLMLGRWNWLAKRFVQLPGAPERKPDEVITFLKSRVVAIADTAR